MHIPHEHKGNGLFAHDSSVVVAPSFLSGAYNTVYAVRADALAQITFMGNFAYTGNVIHNCTSLRRI